MQICYLQVTKSFCCKEETAHLYIRKCLYMYKEDLDERRLPQITNP